MRKLSKFTLAALVVTLLVTVGSVKAAPPADLFHSGYWGYGFPTYFYGYSFFPYHEGKNLTVGVISYSLNQDQVGYAWGYPSVEAASRASLRSCTQEDCAPVVWVQGGCAALATSKTEQRVGWAWAGAKSEAITYALRACRSGGKTKCESRAWVCSF